MPIHELRCSGCGHEFEELVRTQGQKVACPECGGATLERKLSTFAAVVSPSGGAACAARETCSAGTCCAGGACRLDD